jgi:UDP-GlcNAc3NAcA epimerase
MKKIMTVVGARPQIIKSAALTRAIENDAFFQEIKIHTQQHSSESMSGQLFSDLKIKAPDVLLEAPSGNTIEQIAHMSVALQEAIDKHNPDLVLLYGDTNSTIAGALAAAHMQVPIAHVEAGLRSFNRQMPEEINRVSTDHLSTLLFTPTSAATRQLQLEGFNNTEVSSATAANAAVIECGDVMLDNALYYSNGLTKEGESFIFLTLHRPSNVDNPEFLLPFLQELVQIASDLEKELHFAIHPRTAKSLEFSNMKDEWERLKLNSNFILFPPFNYSETLGKLTQASLVWTDSGGLCKEAFYMGTPCLILRSETEWTELVEHGYAKVVHNDLEKIKAESVNFLQKGIPNSLPLYGKGNAAEIILSSIKSFFA